MRFRYAMEKGFNGFRAWATEQAWRFLTFPRAPFLSLTGSGRGNVGLRERTPEPSYAIAVRARYVPNETFLIRFSIFSCVPQ